MNVYYVFIHFLTQHLASNIRFATKRVRSNKLFVGDSLNRDTFIMNILQSQNIFARRWSPPCFFALLACCKDLFVLASALKRRAHFAKMVGLNLTLVLLSACFSPNEDVLDAREIIRPAKVAHVQSASGSGVRSFPGIVEASRKSDLAFRVGGLLKDLQAQPGLFVKKGQILAALDPAEYHNTLADVEAKYKLAKSQYDKTIALKEKNYTSPAHLDEAEANLKAAAAALATAQDNMKYTKLRAPFDGVVSYVGVENYQMVNEKQVVLQLRDENSLDVRFNIPENLLGQLNRIKNPKDICAQIVFNAYPEDSFTACFKEYESQPDEVTRSYSVVLSLGNIVNFSVLPGMTITATLNLEKYLKSHILEGVLAPIESVFEQDGKAWVWKLDAQQRAYKTPVIIGRISDDSLLVKSGLDVGDVIVAAGVSYLQEGMRIKPLSKERGL